MVENSSRMKERVAKVEGCGGDMDEVEREWVEEESSMVGTGSGKRRKLLVR